MTCTKSLLCPECWEEMCIRDRYMGAFLSLSDVVDEEEGEIPSIFAP